MTLTALSTAVVLGVLALADASAESAAELLEKGIYAEETQGDLASAIDIYKKIAAAADAERPTIAQALLRLGACYLKSGRHADAHETFERLASRYAEQKSMAAQIPKTTAEVELLPAPWAEQGERLVLRQPGIRPDSASFTFALVLHAKAHDVDGRSMTSLVTESQISRAVVQVDTKSLRPTERLFHPFRTAASNERWQATYRPTTVTLVRSKDDRTTTRDITVPQVPYDFDELLHLVRRLPLAAGYALNIPVLPRALTQVHKGSIRVTGREAVTVPHGTFQAFKVVLSLEDLATDGFPLGAPQKTCWYSADEHRYLLKLEESGRVWELADVRVGPPATDASFDDKPTGISFHTPAGWLAIRGNAADEPLFVHLVAPGFATLAELRLEPLSTEMTPLTMAEARFEKRRRILRGVREPPASITLNDIPAARVCFDYFSEARYSRVEYAFFISHRGRRLSLMFSSIERDEWESLRPTLDEIAGSLRLQ